MIYRFDRLIFVFKDMDDNIIHLNGEFEFQLTIEDVCDQLHTSVPSTNQFSMIEVFGNNKLDNPLSFNKCYISSVSLSMNGTSSNDKPSIEILTLYPLPTIDSVESHSLNRESFSL